MNGGFNLDRKKIFSIIRSVMNYVGIILTITFMIWGTKMGFFSSSDSLQTSLLRFGAFAALIFILVQIAQVILPILPGATGCVVGVVLFGNLLGFVYNYIGICIGSIIVFLLSRRYGPAFVKLLIGKKAFEKYILKTTSHRNFDVFFACAIFFPVAPDDLLCYIAGLTKMTTKKFITIILLGKPLSIALYSMGLATVLKHLTTLLQ